LILHAEEHRYALDEGLRRDPSLMEGERFMYEQEDRRVRAGLRCTECGEPLGYPIVFWIRGVAGDLYMHPRCARRLAEGILGDVRGIAGTYGEGATR
jgi:hypothetical protein